MGLECGFIAGRLDLLENFDDDTGEAIAVEVYFLVVGNLSDVAKVHLSGPELLRRWENLVAACRECRY